MIRFDPSINWGTILVLLGMVFGAGYLRSQFAEALKKIDGHESRFEAVEKRISEAVEASARTDELLRARQDKHGRAMVSVKHTVDMIAAKLKIPPHDFDPDGESDP